MERHEGRVFKHTGDGMVAAFESASSAIATTVASQLALTREPFEGVDGLESGWGYTAARLKPARATTSVRPSTGRRASWTWATAVRSS